MAVSLIQLLSTKTVLHNETVNPAVKPVPLITICVSRSFGAVLGVRAEMVGVKSGYVSSRTLLTKTDTKKTHCMIIGRNSREGETNIVIR